MDKQLNNNRSFEDILEEKGQTRLFKVVTIGHELDKQETGAIIAATEKFLATRKNDMDDTL